MYTLKRIAYDRPRETAGRMIDVYHCSLFLERIIETNERWKRKKKYKLPSLGGELCDEIIFENRPDLFTNRAQTFSDDDVN